MWHEEEERELVASLRQAGPDAPTLCEGWRTRHLAAHLYLRRHEPWWLAGTVLPPAREASEQHLQRVAGDAADEDGYHLLLDSFTSPLRGANPMRLFGDRARELADLLEFVVHHEDVRRAGEEPAPPRELPPEMEEAVWAHSSRTAPLGFRSSPVGVVLVVPGGPRRVAHKGNVSVALEGAPVELALFAAGRRERAHVRLVGEPEAVAAFETYLTH